MKKGDFCYFTLYISSGFLSAAPTVSLCLRQTGSIHPDFFKIGTLSLTNIIQDLKNMISKKYLAFFRPQEIGV
jgi:hypothetical protein